MKRLALLALVASAGCTLVVGSELAKRRRDAGASSADAGGGDGGPGDGGPGDGGCAELTWVDPNGFDRANPVTRAGSRVVFHARNAGYAGTLIDAMVAYVDTGGVVRVAFCDDRCHDLEVPNVVATASSTLASVSPPFNGPDGILCAVAAVTDGGATTLLGAGACSSFVEAAAGGAAGLGAVADPAGATGVAVGETTAAGEGYLRTVEDGGTLSPAAGPTSSRTAMVTTQLDAITFDGGYGWISCEGGAGGAACGILGGDLSTSCASGYCASLDLFAGAATGVAYDDHRAVEIGNFRDGGGALYVRESDFFGGSLSEGYVATGVDGGPDELNAAVDSTGSAPVVRVAFVDRATSEASFVDISLSDVAVTASPPARVCGWPYDFAAPVARGDGGSGGRMLVRDLGGELHLLDAP